jgi:hypothetical protein
MLIGAGHYLIFFAFALIVLFLAACILSWLDGGWRGSSLYPPASSHIGVVLHSQTCSYDLVADGGEGGR